MAVPFVQGRLTRRHLRARVSSTCACCGETIELDLDSDLRATVVTRGARPFISTPMIDFSKLRDPSIIDAF